MRTLLNHLVNEQLWTPALPGGATVAEVGDRFDGDLLGDDPAAAWTASFAAAHEAIARADFGGTVHVSWGEISMQMYVGQILTDLAVHGWDLARAIGADDTIDREVAEALLPNLEQEKDSIAASGVFGTPVAVPADADTQTRLLALLGRRS